jgi:hypothetical protein
MDFTASVFVRILRHDPPRNETVSLLSLAKWASPIGGLPANLCSSDAAKSSAEHETPVDEWRFHQALILPVQQAMDIPVPANAII